MASKINLQSALVTVGFLVGAYLVYRITGAAYQAADAVVDKLTDTGSKIGSGVYDFFHPDVVGESVFYTVGFPKPVGDAQKHAVPSRSVAEDGTFVLGPTWGNGQATPLQMRRRWRIVVDRSTGAKVAQPV